MATTILILSVGDLEVASSQKVLHEQFVGNRLPWLRTAASMPRR